MANIKNKFTQPLSTEFSPKDLVVDIKNGHLYYKSNLGVHKLVGDNLSTDTENERGYFTAGIEVVGSISSSGTIFTDTISSPSNNLAVSSSTVTITTSGSDANLILQADTGNNDDANNPYMTIEQDGGGMRSIIGLTGADSEWPDGGPLLNGKNNHLIIGTSGSVGSSRGIQLVTLNTASLTILASGNVGIGNNNPPQKLTVAGDISATGNIVSLNGLFTDDVGIGATPTSGALHVNSSEVDFVAYFHNTSLDVRSSDGIGIQCGANTNNTGSIRYIQMYDGDKDWQGAIQAGNGEEDSEEIANGVTLTSLSDRRQKHDIKITKFNLNDLMNIEVVDFKWNKTGTQSTGFIAQQVETVFPQAVTKPNRNTEFYGMDHAGLSPLIVKAIQDQQIIIDSLKARLKILEDKK